ncbi:hypothetical protein CMT41_07670 [Colwellia sp. MT41]|nr:hypothetical protein CMT41_07670 [Colwellia sp. MT41]
MIMIIRIIYLELHKDFMNKFKKEATKKRAKEIEGLSIKQIEAKDERSALLTQLHGHFFPEETDFMMDSNVDAKERKRGENPMSQTYTDKVNAKREILGVPPIKDNGLPADDSSQKHINIEDTHS